MPYKGNYNAFIWHGSPIDAINVGISLHRVVSHFESVVDYESWQ